MPDSWIKKMSKEKNMIEPFADEQNKNGVISNSLQLLAEGKNPIY